MVVGGMHDIQAVGQDMGKAVVVVDSMAMDRFSYSGGYKQVHTVRVVPAIQDTLDHQEGPYSLANQVGQVGPNIQVHRDNRGVLVNQVDLHNTWGYRKVHRIVGMGQGT